MELLRKNISKALEEKGWSDTEFARRVGTTPQEIYRIRKGKSAIGLDKLEAISKALSLSPAQLLAAPAETLEHPLTVCVHRVSEAALGTGSKPKKKGVTIGDFVHVIQETLEKEPELLEELLKELPKQTRVRLLKALAS